MNSILTEASNELEFVKCKKLILRNLSEIDAERSRFTVCARVIILDAATRVKRFREWTTLWRLYPISPLADFGMPIDAERPQRLPFASPMSAGEVTYHPAFDTA